MELKVTPTTPPKVVEARRKATKEAMKRIEDVEELCAKAIDQDSQVWEALIGDEELEKFTD